MENITINTIAKKANVSRGTVDRVLNGRPDVSDKTRKRVLEVIKELEYSPNVVAKALKSKNKKIQIGIIVSPKENLFGRDILKGILYAKDECAIYGVTINIYEMKGFEIDAQLAQIQNAIEDQVNGIALAPMEDTSIRNILKSIEDTIPIAFYNTDIEGVNRICYIGQDGNACGRVGGQLLGMLSGGKGDTAVLLGYKMIRAHLQREDGFSEYLKKDLPEMRLLGTFETREVDRIVYEICEDLFQNNDIKNIFMSGGGIDGLGQFLVDHKLSGKVNVVCTDYISRTAELLKNDVIHFAIGQQPFEQGYYSIKVLSDYLLSGTRPGNSELYTNLDIRIKENIDCCFSEGLLASKL
ncbi:substrate-binding domain-containing protein [Ruminococcus gauvreauii]|uniref:Substrate-binding domain-containing protein n=1 Tax=Ruminococcus gauvreauii TaxID=438033 RepID=A0ABY5VBK3_9FIRM|nr:substrate-binding domain-containing protein [Ruminococcus gauvreauii]UWP57914.1 substrate-binding domain-containing protein [Ruminococcus gauvreauii]